MAYQMVPTVSPQNRRPAPNRMQRIIVKPQFSHGGGGLLVQQPGTYTIYDPKGNQLEQVHTGRPGEGGNIKVPSHSIASGLPQGSYFTGPDGTRYNLTGGSGQRHEFDEGQSNPILVSNKGATGAGGGGASNAYSTMTTPGGNNVVIPGSVNWESLQFNPADWEKAMSDARAAGDQAKIEYLQNIKDSQQPALDLVDTDIKGIQAGENALIPGVRQQGDLDTATNVGRAGQIDTFNQSRLPGINKFNRQEVGETNEFNASQYENAVEKSGIDYRKRVSGVLDALGTEATGKFGDPLLDTLQTATARGRGADIASSAGIGTLSGAGINVQDKIDVNQRIAMAMQAQGMIPGIAGQAQQLLQPPVEQAKTQYLTPTAVPLNVSNIAERMPITASISAGATAQHIADTSQQYEAIPATTALGTNLDTQRFNSTGQFTRDLAVLNGEQSAMTAEANAVQGGFNADKGDQVRAENFDAYQNGLNTASTNQAIGAGMNLLGAGIGAVAANPGLVGLGADTGSSAPAYDSNGQLIQTQIPPADIFATPEGQGAITGSGAYPTSSGGGSTIDPVTGQMIGGVQGGGDYQLPTDLQTSGVGYTSGGGDGGSVFAPSESSPSQLAGPPGLSGGSMSGSGMDYSGFDWSPPSDSGTGGFSPPADTGSWGIGESQFSRSAGSLRVGNTEVSQADYKATMDHIDESLGGMPATQGPARAAGRPAAGMLPGAPVPEAGMPAKPSGLQGPFQEAIGSLKDVRTGTAILGGAVSLLTNWKKMDGAQKLAAAGALGVNILQAKGVLSPVDAKAVSSAAEAMSVLANNGASSTEKTAASGVLGTSLASRSFMGTVENPTAIGGKKVLAPTTTSNGQPGFRLEDGSVVSRGALKSTADANAALKAYQVLMSPAETEKKTAALKAIGVQDNAANDLITRVSRGDTLSALSLFNSSEDWHDQTTLHHAATVMQTTGVIHGAMSAALPSNYRNKSGSGAVAFKSFGASQGPTVSAGPFTVGASGVNADFYGIPVPVVGYGGDSFSASEGGSGIHVGSSGVGASTGLDVGGAHVTIGGGLSPSGGVSISPRVQIGQGAGAAQGSAIGGQAGSLGGAAIFGPIGGMVGGFVGSAIGSLFGGGGSSKDLRNGYRANLVNNGFATKGSDGSVNVPLANGSTYNIGADGGAQFDNTDGSKRFSYEVDWTNPVAADSIPAAHLLAIATGLDPSMTQKDTFNRVGGQLTNAISSNAKNVGDSLNNAKAFLNAKKVSPQNLGMRVEALRVSNKISEQEYKVYLNQMNQMFGTKFQPTDRNQSRDNFLRIFGSNKKPSKQDKEFLKSITNEDDLASNQKKTDKRVASIETNSQGGLPIPTRYRNEDNTRDSNYAMAI